ncbi:hypothetical protein GKQ77_01785 [Streptomyces sp. BG9H]|uniref:Uncharacterized protein n=1 Tax=Streptomyces anatolicus TaxID=2675858 RepID=A0ABS6YFV6_9ACTN|nr:hypothetical protein [Streptomyces anatolicus]MBW5420302.1 hypothetical protein [Streptomyces anatolicus]
MDALPELYAVQHLQILATESGGEHLYREFLVRRAAVLDRFADKPQPPEWAIDQIAYADSYARDLLAYDLMHGSTRGPLPAGAPCWTQNPRGYARQEHRAWIVDHDV